MKLFFCKLFPLCVILVFCSDTNHDETMKQQFDSYLKALNEHDIEKTLSFYSEDFELQFTGSDFTLDKESMVDVLGWDKGVNGEVSYNSLEVEGDSIAGVFTERNDFFELLGIKELKSENVYLFGESGLIVKQTGKLLSGQPSFEKKMKPAVEWARENRPDELNEIYPQNRIQYNQEMGKRWIVLLEEWRKTTTRDEIE